MEKNEYKNRSFIGSNTLNLRQKTIALSVLIFLISLGVGLLSRQDKRFEAGKEQAVIVETYRIAARDILADGVFSLFDSQSQLANPVLNAHPPGYSLLLAAVFYFTGETVFVIQFVSIFFNALSALIIFLIARKLFSQKVGASSGLLAAFSPQLAASSISMLPDTLMIFPLLLGVYFFILAVEKPRLREIVLAAFCVGIACWLRANVLLAPAFFALAMPFLFGWKQSFKFSGWFCAAFVLTIAPMTIRNAVVFGKFVPVSLGMGQTLLEGIGDYDTQNRFGIPATDVGIARREAIIYNRPSYATSLFEIDGIERDRTRTLEGLRVIAKNPFWFAGVMLRRALWMLKFERASLVSTNLAATAEIQNGSTMRNDSAADLLAKGVVVSTDAKISGAAAQRLILETDTSKNASQFAAEPFLVSKNKQYLVTTNLHIAKGRISIKTVGADSGEIYCYTVIAKEEWENDTPLKKLQSAFVAGRDESVRVIVFNESRISANSEIEIENIELKNLGDASFIWLRPFRFLIHYIQKIFVEGIMLALVLAGLVIAVRQKKWNALIILGIVPVYYFCVQSVLHTELRYVLAIHYFLFVSVAVCFTKAEEYLFKAIRVFIVRAEDIKKSMPDKKTESPLWSSESEITAEFEAGVEGNKKQIYTTFCERLPENRREAIKIHGLTCKVCNFNFEKTYGPRGKGFIHVHYVNAVSKFEKTKRINPETDLTVLCPNCHSMIHKQQDNALSVESLKKIVKLNSR